MAEQIKCLHNAIDLATSDMQHGPNAELYSQVETWITVRADMYSFYNSGPSIVWHSSRKG